jgi:TldD protein
MDELVEYAIDCGIKLGAEYVEGRLQKDVEKRIGLRNSSPEPPRLVKMKGIGVRVLVDGSISFASTNDLTKDNVRRIVETAYKVARVSSRLVKYPVKLSREEVVETAWDVKPKIPVENISVEEKFQTLNEMDKTLISESMKIKIPSRVFTLSDTLQEKFYINSEGTRIHSKVSRISLNCSLTAFEPGKGTVQRQIQKSESRGWEAVEEWNLTQLLTEEAQALNKILNAMKAPKEELDLILGPEVVGIICHESCGHPGEMDRILGREAAQAGESYLKPDMVGFKVGSEAVTIVDDPTIPHSNGFYLYDDEGVKAKRRILIKNGVISDFLHNRETAAELRTKSNGAARAVAYNREPMIRMANTFMLPGEYTFEELIEDIKVGVYIKSFTEWNIDDRRYTQRYVGHEAYMIENGEIKSPVKNPVLEITTPSLYGSIDAVSRTLKFDAASCGKGDPVQLAPVWLGGPEARLRKVKLGGTS